MNGRRPPGFDSLAPLSYSEIYHSILLTGRSATYRDIRWLIQMDNAWLEQIARERTDRREREREQAEREKAKPKHSRRR